MEQGIINDILKRITILEEDIKKMNMVLGTNREQLDAQELYNSI